MKLGVTNHAVERYIERYKPQLGTEQARAELKALAGFVEQPLPEKPAWISAGQEPDCWVEIAENVIAAVRDGGIVTVFVRTGSSKKVRAEKKAEKRKQRSHQRWQNKLRRPGQRQHGKEFEWA